MSLLWHAWSPSSPQTARTRRTITAGDARTGMPPAPCRHPEVRGARLAPRDAIPALSITLLLLTAGTLLLMAATLGSAPLPAPVPPAATTSQPTRPSSRVDATVILSVDLEPLPAAATFDLVRLIAEPGSRGAPLDPAVQFLTIESGTLTVALDGPAQVLAEAQPPVRVEGQRQLGSGASLVWPATTSVTWVNATRDPVVMLALGLFPEAGTHLPVGLGQPDANAHSARWDAISTPGTTLQPLASGPWGSQPAGPVGLTLWRLSVPSHDETAIAAVGAVAMTVETGTASLLIADGVRWVETPRQGDPSLLARRAASLMPGESAVVLATSCVRVRNPGSGPLLLLGLTRDPVSPRASLRSDARHEAAITC